jgi:hypothetical protein
MPVNHLGHPSPPQTTLQRSCWAKKFHEPPPGATTKSDHELKLWLASVQTRAIVQDTCRFRTTKLWVEGVFR